MSGDETVLAATGNCYKPRCSTFLEVSGGDGNLSDDEVHLLLRSDDGEFAQGWFEAAALVGAVERARAWAIEQGRPFPDGVRDREGEAVQAGCLAALDGDDGKGEA